MSFIIDYKLRAIFQDRVFTTLSLEDPMYKGVLKPKLSIEFSVLKGDNGENSLDLTIYNLSEENRSIFRKDTTNYTTRFDLELECGYRDQQNYSLVFKGQIQSAMSVRNGVDWVTTCSGKSMGQELQYTSISSSVKSGMTSKEVLKSVIGANFVDLSFGAIGKVGDFKFNKSQVLFGNIANNIDQISQGQAFIDNGVINILDRDEYLDNNNVVLTDTLLTKSLSLEENLLRAECLFLPNARVGALCVVNSRVYHDLNGNYKITHLGHNVSITSSGGSGITSLTLMKLGLNAKAVV